MNFNCLHKIIKLKQYKADTLLVLKFLMPIMKILPLERSSNSCAFPFSFWFKFIGAFQAAAKFQEPERYNHSFPNVSD